MNAIKTKVTKQDCRRGQGTAALARDILESLVNGCPYDVSGFTDEQIAQLKYHFELWANSWIAPRCRSIIAKTHPPKE